MKYVILPFLMFLAACSPQVIEEPDLIGCQEDAKICPDGTVLVREGPNCEFPDCPEVEEGKSYIAFGLDDCSVIKFSCDAGKEAFFDDKGCGCEVSDEQTKCKPSQRDVDSCIEIYQPVCGWFNQNINCIKYPCANTYSNSCFACQNGDVEYYTEGECPE